MTSVPPSGMASRALTARLTRIWSIWARSTRMCPIVRSRFVTSAIGSPINRRRNGSSPSRMTLRSCEAGARTVLRAKPRSWRVRSAARSAAFTISSTSARTDIEAGSCAVAICP